MSPSLVGVRAKLDRAWEHIETLDAATAEFFESKPYEVVGEFEPDVSEWVVSINPFTEPPPRVPVILGDVLHNLRSALDHLVCQLALLDTGETADCAKTQFPITSSEDNFMEKEPAGLRGLSDVHRAQIERHQPYHAGARMHDHVLMIVSSFNNVDKHAVVHPLFGYYRGFADIPTVEGNFDAGVIPSTALLLSGERRVEGKTQIARVKLRPIGPNPHVDVYGTLVFDPAFGKRWLRGSALPEIHQQVVRIVDGFAADFV